MKHRKCDTMKYRRRMKKQKENRQQRSETATPAEQEEMIRQAHQEPAPGFINIPKPEPVATVSEPEKVTPEPPPPPARPVCPLCKQDITLEQSQTKTVDVILFNMRLVTVHKTCPTETK